MADYICSDVELCPRRTKRWITNGIGNSTIVKIIVCSMNLNRTKIKLGFKIVDVGVAAVAKA